MLLKRINLDEYRQRVLVGDICKVTNVILDYVSCMHEIHLVNLRTKIEFKLGISPSNWMYLISLEDFNEVF